MLRLSKMEGQWLVMYSFTQIVRNMQFMMEEQSQQMLKMSPLCVFVQLSVYSDLYTTKLLLLHWDFFFFFFTLALTLLWVWYLVLITLSIQTVWNCVF